MSKPQHARREDDTGRSRPLCGLFDPGGLTELVDDLDDVDCPECLRLLDR